MPTHWERYMLARPRFEMQYFTDSNKNHFKHERKYLHTLSHKHCKLSQYLSYLSTFLMPENSLDLGLSCSPSLLTDITSHDQWSSWSSWFLFLYPRQMSKLTVFCYVFPSSSQQLQDLKIQGLSVKRERQMLLQVSFPSVCSLSQVCGNKSTL